MSIKNGKPFNSSDFKKQMEKQIVSAVKRKLPEIVAENLKDEITGERPQVTIDDKHIEKLSDLNEMKATIVGSKELIANVNDKLGSENT